jgi:hypothetical protein
MTNRQALLSVIDQLPDQQLHTLLTLAQQLVQAEHNPPELPPEQLADLRSRLSQFAEEWDSPEMEIYDCFSDTNPGDRCPIA